MGLTFNNDTNINIPLFSIIILLTYLIITIYIIIIITSFYNLLTYFYNEAVYKILLSEEENVYIKNTRDSCHYRLLNFVNCFEEKDPRLQGLGDNTSKESENNSIIGYIYYIFKSFIGIFYTFEKSEHLPEKNNSDNSCNYTNIFKIISSNERYIYEKDFNILIEYNLYNIIFKIAIIINILLFTGILINFFITYFLRREKYVIEGSSSIKDYILNNKNSLSISIIYIFTAAVIIYCIIYKKLFIDNVYTDIYNNYINILQLDIFILDEANKVNLYDKNFFVLLKNVNVIKYDNGYKISEEYENNIINTNIEQTTNEDIRNSKYLLLGFYKYIIYKNPQDIDTINKLNNFIISKNKNIEYNTTISLRDFLPITLNNYEIDNEINFEMKFNIKNEKFNNKKNELIYILKHIDDKFDLSDSVSNLGLYLFVVFIINILFFVIILFVIYNNDYNNDSNTDKGRNFIGIKSILDFIRKNIFKNQTEYIPNALPINPNFIDYIQTENPKLQKN
jgi:hypothetical protein